MKIGLRKYYDGVLDIPEGKVGKFRIRHIKHPAGAPLKSGTMRTAYFGQTSEDLVYDKDTVWHELTENGGVWMTDLPIEQRQHDEILVRAKGRVLVGGLGIGYAVVALAVRPKVKEIVVVEKSPEIIKLTWKATVKRAKALRPDIKLTVIEADLFKYLKARQKVATGKPEFSWGFFDIWQGDGESTFHTTVVPLRQLADGVVTTVTCWNEDVMRGQLLMGLHSRLMLMDNASMGLSLADLTKERGSIYTDWAVPFWRWVKDHPTLKAKKNQELVQFVMRQYVMNYGKPEMMNGIPALRKYRLTPEAEATA